MRIDYLDVPSDDDPDRPLPNTIPGRIIVVWFCPITGRVIEGLPWDDKVLCPCQQSNPRVPQEAPGVHLVRFLVPATEQDWLIQKQNDVRR